jgi:hypothetical protein
MNQAIRASITLLDPAGLTRLDARFWWWFTISGLASLTPIPLRRHLARWLDSPVMLERELMTLMWAGSRGLPDGAEVPRHPHRRRTPGDRRAGPADHRRAQRHAHPGGGPLLATAAHHHALGAPPLPPTPPVCLPPGSARPILATGCWSMSPRTGKNRHDAPSTRKPGYPARRQAHHRPLPHHRTRPHRRTAGRQLQPRSG